MLFLRGIGPCGFRLVEPTARIGRRLLHLSAIQNPKSLAQEIEDPKAVNLIVLGFALATAENVAGEQNKLFCSAEEIKTVLKKRFGKNPKMLSASLKALEAGYSTKDI